MKKLGLILLIGAAAWLMGRLPHPAVDIGKLEPVEVVLLTATDQGIRMETDTGTWGEGETLEDAVTALKQADSGEVFLDTAEKVLIRGDMTDYWAEIWAHFRPAAQVCLVRDEVDLQEAADYLTMHPTGLTLGKLRVGLGEWKTLTITEGRGRLEDTG